MADHNAAHAPVPADPNWLGRIAPASFRRPARAGRGARRGQVSRLIRALSCLSSVLLIFAVFVSIPLVKPSHISTLSKEKSP